MIHECGPRMMCKIAYIFDKGRHFSRLLGTVGMLLIMLLSRLSLLNPSRETVPLVHAIGRGGT